MEKTSKQKLLTEEQLEEKISKEEMNLVEYPFTLLTRRAPRGVKTLKYFDWITVGGVKKQVKWIVTGSDEFGLPIGGDQDIWVAIMEVWREHGFKEDKIPIGSIYRMLKKMGLPTDKRNYDRFKKGLDRLRGTYIKTEYAIWDKTDQCYIATKGFSMIGNYYLLERHRKGDKTEPFPLGYILADPFVYQMIKKGYLKDLNLTFYYSLSTPLTKRLYRYLDKKRYLTSVFSIELYRFIKKMGLLIENLPPSRVKQTLNPALDELRKRGFLKDYSYQKTADGKGQKIIFFFNQLPAKVTRLTQEDGQIELLVEDILAVCKDRHSEPFYKKVAQLLPEQVVRRAISEVKASVLQGEVKTSPGKLFTHLIKKYAQDFGIVL